jgi:hypothetical protein
MGFSIHVDWSDENSFERWEQVGQDAMRNFYAENPDEVVKEGYEVEDNKIDDAIDELIQRHYPMMNYAYPLETEPSDEKVVEICQNTNLTVVKDNEDDTYYLALTGGGMDLSQDIALAYIIAETWLPLDLLRDVCTQPNLSVHGKNWLKVARQIRRQEMMEIKNFQQSRKQWARQIKEYKNIMAERKARKLKEAQE